MYNEEQAHAFIAHQRTIDTLLCLPYTPESRTEMIDQFRRMYIGVPSILAEIDLFDKIYNCNSALQWYTRDSFLFRTINQILRSSNVELMFKFRYFLTDLYVQLHELHQQTLSLRRHPVDGNFYRGQMMSTKEFRFFERSINHIISFSTFFSTTTSLQVALTFVDSSSISDDYLPVLFCIRINPFFKSSRPHANISDFSICRDEEEVLFAMGTIFLLEKIVPLDQTNPIPVIYLEKRSVQL